MEAKCYIAHYKEASVGDTGTVPTVHFSISPSIMLRAQWNRAEDTRRLANNAPNKSISGLKVYGHWFK